MDDQTSPQEPIPELALAVPQDASNLARALDLEVATVSAWLTQGLGIVARYGSRIVGLAHLVSDGILEPAQIGRLIDRARNP